MFAPERLKAIEYLAVIVISIGDVALSSKTFIFLRFGDPHGKSPFSNANGSVDDAFSVARRLLASPCDRLQCLKTSVNRADFHSPSPISFFTYVLKTIEISA